MAGAPRRGGMRWLLLLISPSRWCAWRVLLSGCGCARWLLLVIIPSRWSAWRVLLSRGGLRLLLLVTPSRWCAWRVLLSGCGCPRWLLLVIIPSRWCSWRVLLSWSDTDAPDRICVYTAYVTTSQQCPACVGFLRRTVSQSKRGVAALCNLVVRIPQTVADLGIGG